MFKILSSYYLMIVLFLSLAIGAAVATFVENDFTAAVARMYVYNALWYEALLTLAGVNLLAIFFKTKLYQSTPKAIFHTAFIVILLGAGLTRFWGYEGSMHIREGKESDIVRDLETRKKSLLPFVIKLDNFKMIRYPGSASPSEYSSYVTVIDKENSQEFSFHIYMNHTLDYRGYKFFQTSYDIDERGTILTVNKDPGKITTYIGYALLILGLILNLFDKKSRFQKLFKRVNKNVAFSFLALFILEQDLKASEYQQEYLLEHKKNSLEASEAFGRLIVQSRMGRMKPLDTLNREIVRKLTGKQSILGMTPNQIVLGMFLRERIWKSTPMIKVKTPKLKKRVGLEGDELGTFRQFFRKGKYILEKDVEKAHALKPSMRGTYERDLISVDERLNIAFMVYYGSLFKIYPLIGDKDNSWLDFRKIWEFAQGEQGDKIRFTAKRFVDAGFNRDYKKLITEIKNIQTYQRTFGEKIIPSEARVEQEILLNKSKVFPRVTLAYILFGLALLIYTFATIFYPKLFNKKIYYTIVAIASSIFLIHTAGLGARWYISGHAPFSDTYESIIYIAYSAMFAGIVFFRRSLFALCAASIMAGVFMFAGHLGNIDPEITNLVPVLKSFWLTIHVSIITGSYGFLGVSALLGAMTLILFSLKKRKDLTKEINQLTDINEISLILGLTFLVIGNFLGGVWANESWGRYWGWDPKETWAYISILIYTLVTHLRLVKKIYSKYLFALLSLISFASILMTYFGVNFYLAGMHSYATGDPVPIPSWVYYLTGAVVLLITISYKNRDRRSSE